MNSASFLITCPKCTHQFSVSEELQKSMQDSFAKDLEIQKKDWEAKLKLQEELNEKKMIEEKQKLWAIAQVKANEKIQSEYAVQMQVLKEQNESFQKKWELSQQKEIEFLKKEQELMQQQKMMELEMQKKMLESQTVIREQMQKEAEESHRLKDLEKEKQLEQMRKTIDELKRKSEQGSMQIQGDVQENDLKEALIAQFPFDTISDVPTGMRGADLLHSVTTPMGKVAGKIIWESKNTKNWTEGWIQKLKDDQVEARADIAILATQVLPEGVDHYVYRNGVWVVKYQYALPLVSFLRFHLLEMEKTKTSMVGQDEKMQMIMTYLSSPQFKNRIENIVEAFSAMKEDLDKEKRAMQTIWNRREKELERVMLNTSGIYGDFQGLLGAGMPIVKQLDLLAEIE